MTSQIEARRHLAEGSSALPEQVELDAPRASCDAEGVGTLGAECGSVNDPLLAAFGGPGGGEVVDGVSTSSAWV